jgi:hypothetical protein
MIEMFAPFSSPETKPAPRQDRGYTALDDIVRPMLTTAEAAYYLNRRPQTLRIWACKEEGPIRPVRLHGRLGWPLSEIRQYLGVQQKHTESAH